MPPKKLIDESYLLKMVQDSVPQKEIMAHLKIKTSTQLKVAYIDALMRNGTVPAIHVDRQPKIRKRKAIVKVNKSGSLVISKPVADQFGLKEGDAFEASKTSSGLLLQPAAPKPVVKLRKKTSAA